MTIISRMTETSGLPGYRPARRATRPALRTGARAKSLWDRLLNAIAPLGYEDETGFHYGVPSKPERLFN